jgi:hypothetical protein
MLLSKMAKLVWPCCPIRIYHDSASSESKTAQSGCKGESGGLAFLAMGPYKMDDAIGPSIAIVLWCKRNVVLFVRYVCW